MLDTVEVKIKLNKETNLPCSCRFSMTMPDGEYIDFDFKEYTTYNEGEYVIIVGRKIDEDVCGEGYKNYRLKEFASSRCEFKELIVEGLPKDIYPIELEYIIFLDDERDYENGDDELINSSGYIFGFDSLVRSIQAKKRSA